MLPNVLHNQYYKLLLFIENHLLSFQELLMQFISAIFHFSLPERLAGLIPLLRFYRTWRNRHSNKYFLETSENYTSENTSRDIKEGIVGKNFHPVGASNPTMSQPGESSI